MGAKDSMIMYAPGDIRPILQAAPPIDRDATRALVERLHPGRRLKPVDDGDLSANANPPDGFVYAGCFPGLTVVCTGDVGLDLPSKLDRRFLAEANGRSLYLHGMHSAVDWFAYGIWTGEGELQRALSLSPDHGIMENIGTPLPFEAAYWAGEFPVEVDEDDEDDEDDEPYPLPFHPLELAEDALRFLFGFNYEGDGYVEDDPDLTRIVLSGFFLDRD